MLRSLSRTACFLLAAFILCSTVGAGELARPVPSDAQVTRFTRFNIRYTLRDIIAEGVRKVDFYITDDMGATWRYYGEDQDRTSPMTVEVPGEGVYGFVCVVTDRDGNREREPGPRTRPETVIVVDRTPPTAKWIAPAQDIIGRGQPVVFSWESADQYFGDAPVTLQYAANAQSNHDRNANWQVAADSLPAVGTHTWTPPGSGVYNFRLLAEDRAGNVAVAYCAATARVDNTPPRIVSVRPLRSNTLDNNIVVDAEDNENGSGVKEYSLYVSDNGSATWTLIKENVDGVSLPVKRGNGEAIAWKAPRSGEYPLWPVVFDAAGNATPLPSVGVSGPYLLTIDNEPPQVTLSNSFLLGRAAALANETRRVEWTSYDTHIKEGSAKIHLSLDNGATWQELRSLLPANGFETISFPFGAQSEEAKLKVTVEDDFGNVGESVSETFTLSAAETTIDSVTPRGGGTPPADDPNQTFGFGGTGTTPIPSVDGGGWFGFGGGGAPDATTTPAPLPSFPQDGGIDSYGGSGSDAFGGGGADMYGPLGGGAGLTPYSGESTAGSMPQAMLGGGDSGGGFPAGPGTGAAPDAGADSLFGGGFTPAPPGGGSIPPPAPGGAAAPDFGFGASPSPDAGWQPSPGAGAASPDFASGWQASAPASSPAGDPAGGFAPPPWGASAPGGTPSVPGDGSGATSLFGGGAPETGALPGQGDWAASPAQPGMASADASAPFGGFGGGDSFAPPPVQQTEQPAFPDFASSGDSGLSLDSLGGGNIAEGFGLPGAPFQSGAAAPAPGGSSSGFLRPPSSTPPAAPVASGAPSSPGAAGGTDVAAAPPSGSGSLPWPAATEQLPPTTPAGPPPAMPQLGGGPDAGLSLPQPLAERPEQRPVNQRQASDHHVRESRAFRDEGRVDLAMDSAKKALEADPGNPAAMMELSQVNARMVPPDHVTAANLAKEATNLEADWETWWNCADVFYIWANASNREIQAMQRAGQTPPVNLVDERNSTLSNALIAVNNAASLVPPGNMAAARKVAVTQGMIAYQRALSVPEPYNPGAVEGPALDDYRRRQGEYKTSASPLLQEAMPYFRNAMAMGGPPEYTETFQLGIINFRLANLERDTGNASQATTYYQDAITFLEQATTAANAPKEGPREAYYMLALCYDQLAMQPSAGRARYRELALRYWRQTADFYERESPYRIYAEQRIETLGEEMGL